MRHLHTHMTIWDMLKIVWGHGDGERGGDRITDRETMRRAVNREN
jgi:hypothetical protein